MSSLVNPTIDATISKISYAGDFVTDSFKLEITDVLNAMPLRTYDFTVLPDSSTNEKFLYYAVPYVEGLPDKLISFVIKHATEEYVVASRTFMLKHDVHADEKIAYIVDMPFELMVEESETPYTGTFKIKYCVYPSTNLGKIEDLIANIDCICKYLSGGGGSEFLKSELTKRINALDLKLQSALAQPSPPSSPAMVQEMPCLALQRIKTRLGQIKSNPAIVTADNLAKIKELVSDLYWFFAQNVGLDFCSSKKKFSKGATTRSQSDELYLQAAGSDGSTGITYGIHLRWALTGDVGNKHLPKGNLASSATSIYHTTAGYSNNPDDFVHLYRTPYINPPVFDFKLDDAYRVQITPVEGTNRDKWEFLSGNQFIELELIDNGYISGSPYLSLVSSGVYDCSSLKDFFMNYTEVFSLRFFDRDQDGNPIGTYKKAYAIEILGDNYNSQSDPNADLCRYTFEGRDSQAPFSVKGNLLVSDFNGSEYKKKIFSEEIHRAWFKTGYGAIDKIRVEFYDDFIFSPTREWDIVGNYALSITDQEAEDRLEGVGGNYLLEEFWPRYNDGVFINSANYTDKWSAPGDGIKAAVESYLDLSKNASNLKAIGPVTGDDGKMRISHLNVLKFMSLDYHTARMLGLGYIDQSGISGNQYVYLAYYKCPAREGLSAVTDPLEHMFMSLPTKEEDARPPFVPAMDNFTHNVPSEDDCSSDKLVDENGYSYFDQSRCININRGQYVYESLSRNPSDILSDPSLTFNLTGDNTKPYFYGIEYGLGYLAGIPELTNLPSIGDFFPDYNEYKDFFNDGTDYVPTDEVPLIPEKSNPLYTHMERQAGNHHYALYTVNWFAKACEGVSNVQQIASSFINKNIKPPVDLAVQYIQEEEPVVFTSATEQTMLAARKISFPADPYVTRATFNWNNYQNSAYQFAREVYFYFRSTLPVEIKGRVKTVTPVAGTHRLTITTDSFKLVNTSPQKTIVPIVDTGIVPSIFIGSKLITRSGQFLIVDAVKEVNNYIRITVEQELVVNNVENIDDTKNMHTYESVCSYKSPEIAELFTITENINNAGAWTKLSGSSNKVVLTNFLNGGATHAEEYVNSDGQTIESVIGGIYVAGSVLTTTTPPYDLEPGNPPCYVISFNYPLPLNPAGNGSNVEFYGGLVRLKDNAGNMRALTVFNIQGLGTSNIVLHAYDPYYTPSEYILTGSSGVYINFHPGYRIYLAPEGNFNKNNILPAGTSQIRKTMIAAKAYDGTNGYYAADSFKAPFSSPAVLTALKQNLPVKPLDPQNDSFFATKPDRFGKSSYTFDTEISTAHAPFAFSFYRANDEAILRALYLESSLFGLTGIKSKLLEIVQNNNEDLRFKELAGVVLNTGNTAFKTYNNYALPFPDNNLAMGITGSDTLTQKIEKIKKAVLRCFVPVNHQPCIYEYIRLNADRRTSSKSPVITNTAGALLQPTDPAFVPFPYCITYTSAGKTFLRFTDYTLDGKSQNRYFYFTKEIANNLAHGEPSNILGPVNLINSSPFDAPYIQKQEIVLSNVYNGNGPGIRFFVNPYSLESGVKQVEIYRTLIPELSNDIAAMHRVGAFNIDDDIVDYFNDYSFAPAEENIYFRLVATREIRNEYKDSGTNEHLKDIFRSAASKSVMIQIPDSSHPVAPVLTVNGDLSTFILQGLYVEFNSTMYKGKYYLYQLTKAGNWKLINQMENSADDSMMQFYLPDLDSENANGELISHCFKLVAENRSGLTSREDEICVVRRQ
jgi:hypothetical protein